MAMRLQEIHPSLVHYPLALLPLSIGADLIGRATGSKAIKDLGRTTIPLAAASAAAAAVAGLVAQEEVNATGEARDKLVTHRNLNLGMVGAATAMAIWRSRHEEATPGYLALGLAGLATMMYTAYLGGNMVYEHGVGVLPAGGVRGGVSPELTPGNMTEAARTAAADLRQGAQTVIEETRRGELAPHVRRTAEEVETRP
ncbi:MAG TPA: DUF2231 domain-containing protein [Gemmatimonadaceae bacterium]|nr:DUF2231 domain-containing protein [Gemmatimonadaceae bacterium]